MKQTVPLLELCKCEGKGVNFLTPPPPRTLQGSKGNMESKKDKIGFNSF